MALGLISYFSAKCQCIFQRYWNSSSWYLFKFWPMPAASLSMCFLHRSFSGALTRKQHKGDVCNFISAYTALIARTVRYAKTSAYLHKVTENEFGFPSGHAQCVGFLGFLGLRNKRTRIIIIGAIAVFLVSLSRIYLGVHYPGDVIGALFLACWSHLFHTDGTGILNYLINKVAIQNTLLLCLYCNTCFNIIFAGGSVKEQIELDLYASVVSGYYWRRKK